MRNTGFGKIDKMFNCGGWAAWQTHQLFDDARHGAAIAVGIIHPGQRTAKFLRQGLLPGVAYPMRIQCDINDVWRGNTTALPIADIDYR